MTGIRTSFCGIDTVSCLAGISTNRVYELVDSGHYLWVWNVSSGRSGKRQLRFWTREINDPTTAARLTLDDVLKFIIPKRAHVPGQFEGLRNWELRHILRISKPCLCAMRKELGIHGTSRNLLIPRPNVERFFRRRWLGNIRPECPPKTKPQRKRGRPPKKKSRREQNRSSKKICNSRVKTQKRKTFRIPRLKK